MKKNLTMLSQNQRIKKVIEKKLFHRKSVHKLHKKFRHACAGSYSPENQDGSCRHIIFSSNYDTFIVFYMSLKYESMSKWFQMISLFISFNLVSFELHFGMFLS